MNQNNEKVNPLPPKEEDPQMQSPLITSDGDAYDIPEEGSLGLLAMGYAGIMLWREKRNTAGK